MTYCYTIFDYDEDGPVDMIVGATRERLLDEMHAQGIDEVTIAAMKALFEANEDDALLKDRNGERNHKLTDGWGGYTFRLEFLE